MSDSFFGFDSSLPSHTTTARSTLDQRLAEQDLEIYDFAASSYNGLQLDEGMNEYNDDTFGAFEDLPPTQDSVGRDFDFAGSTSKFLNSNLPSPVNSDSRNASPSPWSSLDVDPLLSGGPLQPYPTSSTSTPQSYTPSKLSTTTTATTKRGMRTLDEIEAELKATSSQSRAVPPPSRKPLTLEEVEAEMLANSRRSAPAQTVQPQQQQQQQNYAPSPLMHSAFPPLSNTGQQLPPRQPQQQQQPPMMMMGMPPQFPPHQQMQQQQFQQQQFMNQRQMPPQMLPPHLHPSQQGRQSPLQPLQNNMINTLFPPLPSQQNVPVPLLTIEQQLQHLTMLQHGQHPSLTAAQLQGLLQQAQIATSVSEAKSEQAKAGEELIRNVEMRIREHEMMEQKRKSKAAKIASMARHNNLMSNSDKDFITRIQVSQLVTDDPYADDFYFHIMNAIKASRHAAALAAAGPDSALALQQGMRNNGRGGQRTTRRDNAMNRMAQNVQRLVDVAKQRNKSGHLSLDGTLGKIALRTRSAPRQLLQVSPGATPTPTSTAGHDLLANLLSGSTNEARSTEGRRSPLSHRSILMILEQIYDAVLDLEQLKRMQPALIGTLKHFSFIAEDEEIGEVQAGLISDAKAALERWDVEYAELSEKLWKSLRVMEPLDDGATHPFISLMSVLKGKRILPRALRHTSPEQTLTLLTLMVATFDTLDTVQDAHLLDASDDLEKLSSGSLEGKSRRAAVEVKTEAFVNAIISPVMVVIGRIELRMVTGMLGLLMERNDLAKVVRSKPGIAVLTIFLSRAETLKQATPAPDASDLLQWQQTFTSFFTSLSHDFPSLFPSNRAVASLPFGPGYYLSGAANASLNTLRPDIDRDDEPVWRFLAAVAVCADSNQQQGLVTALREKVVENANCVGKKGVSEEIAELKIRNVNLLLHSLGLDASQLVSE